MGQLRTLPNDYIEDLGWNIMRLHPSEMMEVVADLDMWRFNLEMLPQECR